jgi:hypothetical protein
MVLYVPWGTMSTSSLCTVTSFVIIIVFIGQNRFIVTYPLRPSRTAHPSLQRVTVLISQSSVDADNEGLGGVRVSTHSSVFLSCKFHDFILSSFHPPPHQCNALPQFHEDTLNLLRISTQTFQVLARCRRCLIICVNRSTEVRMKEPF